ncbi:hypothetical protein [Intrasporangium sp.]|uniref:hypothetical protein n=1 Tax=Intrasporangium sp. TaxID=1925024 RepID=UPI003365424E
MDSPPVAEPASPRVGKYGPLVHLARFDLAAEELTWQLPVNGELYRLVPGPDRPDYSLMLLRRPLHFYPIEGFDLERVDPEQRISDRKGRPMVRVHALVVCARFVGQQLRPGMADLPVHLAYVIDNSLARDERIDFAKIEFAGAGYLSDGHMERRPPNAPAPRTESARSPEAPTASNEGQDDAVPGADVAREAADVLRRGIEERRGSPVDLLSATFSLNEGHRVTGLTGNADGQPPEPTAETFARLDEVFARLGEQPATVEVRTVRIRLGRGTDEVELRPG